jgi:hypothetical protein
MGFNGLSKKQELFIKLHVVDGLNISDAYREAYDTKTNKQNSLYNQASMLASNPKVAQRIMELKRSIENKLASEVVWDRNRIVSELAVNVELARDHKQMAASNRSLELVAKITGVISTEDTKQLTGTVSVIHSLSDAVLEQLAAMASEPVAIDDTGSIEASYQILDTEPDGA